MKITLLKTFFPALFAVVLLCSTPAFAQPAARIAGLEQDVVDMKAEIARLRAEVADLKALVERSQAQNNASGAGNAALQQQLNAQSAATTQALQAQNAEMNRRLTKMAEETNKAMADLTKQVNAALRGGGGSAVAQQNPQVQQPPAAPGDMPQTGITYKIKPGDTISKIARAHGSRTNWILAANKLSQAAAASIQVGQEIFIPQRSDGTAADNN